MIAIVAKIAAFFGVSWLKFALIGGAVVAAIGYYGYTIKRAENRGYERAIADIAANDRKAVERATQGRSRVRECDAAGGVWDSTTGKCVGRGVSVVPAP